MAPKVGEFTSAIYTRSTSLIKTRFTKLKTVVDELAQTGEPLTPVQLKQLAAHENEIRKKKAEFENNLQRALFIETDPIPDGTLSRDQDDIESLFSYISATIEVLIPPEVPKTPSAFSDVSATSQSPVSHVRLPQLDLQKFSGDPLTWTSFINLFDTTIHRNAALSSVMKFQYLLSVLSNEPLNLVKSLNLTAANYLVAYNLLRERYHNSRRLQSLHLNQLLDLPNITATSLKGLRSFVNLFTEHSQALNALECNVTDDNPLLSALLLRKMDNDLRKKLEGFRTYSAEEASSHSLPDVTDIIKFLNLECSQTEDANIHSTSHSKPAHSNLKAFAPKKVPFRTSDVSMVTAHSNTSQPPSAASQGKHTMALCFACNSSGHKIYSCAAFREKSPHDRQLMVKDHRRCISCLGNHDIKECRSQGACQTCNKRHHTLLHFPTSQGKHANYSTPARGNKPPQLAAPIKETASHEATPHTSVTMTAQGHPNSRIWHSTVLLGTALIKLTSSHGTTHVFRALIDCGSMTDLITERAAQLLCARRFKSEVQLTGLGNHMTKNKGQTLLNIETLSGLSIASQHPMLILDHLTTDLPRVPISPEVFQLTKGYVLADPTFHLPGSVDVVLGGALFPRLFTHDIHELGPGLPHLFGTHFGYVVMGSAPCDASAYPISHLVTLHSACDSTDLHSSLQRFWTQEELPNSTRKSQEEEACDQHFAATHSRTEDGRYVVQLPFKSDHPPIGQSREIATKRLSSLERKFQLQPQLRDLYVQYMRDGEAAGHLTKVHDFEENLPHNFLPHHGILKTKGDTSKLRVVYDASCKTSSGQSLNDTLLVGPKLQTNISDVLLKFRTHNIVFTCDIRQMYLQILVQPSDQLFQLVLWREQPSDPLSIFKLTRVTFGVNCSPFLAIRTLHQLAKDEGRPFPEAAQVLATETYIDDIVSGADTLDEAKKLQEDLIKLLKLGHFELRKWTSNSPELLQALPEDYRDTPVFLENHNEPHLTILGLRWSPETDAFTYDFNVPPSLPTKRHVLSTIARIYDPCGHIAPCIMLAKCYMQLLWTQGLQWDEPLTPDLQAKWATFVSTLSSLSLVSIPRALRLSAALSIEVHGFCDASEAGFAAVLYLRCQLANDEILVRQIFAKTRVAPLKRVTLPRLELCAAHLLAQLTAHCCTIFEEHLSLQKCFLWCDSTVALTWLQTPSYRLKTYVANRVAQTQELIPPSSWRYIPSKENPADCASRGILASELVKHPLWWTGPPWLSMPPSHWPDATLHPDTDTDLSASEEMKTTPLVVLTSAHQAEWDLLSTYSSWNKLVRIVALLLRFIGNCRNSALHGPLSPSELNSARLKIFKLVQGSSFAEDISSLQRQQDCSTRLQRLKPFLDADGLLRVGGRLSRTSLSSDIRHPVLLPKKHHIVDLLVDHCHTTHLHSGPQLTQALLSQSVWILCARSVIRSRIFKCVTCFKNKPRNVTPLMGDLPPSRVTPARPFSSTGMDYCGPFMNKILTLRSIKHVKVYLCIFVCMVTKAVHLEVVTDLTTDGFIAALTRFVSRRGLCSDLYSDCGTNFTGADATLRRLIDTQVNSTSAQEVIHRFTTPRGISFHFNPPAAPHQGGLWESAVKSAKYHLKRVMGDTVLTLPEFITLSTQVEAMLNSRPLTPLSSDPSDLTALTPGHFLIGTALAAIPERNVSEVPLNRLKHWQLTQSFHQRIWQRWSLEYIHMLQQRSKWTSSKNNIKIGDLVLVHTPSAPLTWPLARVTGTHPGKDGIVRVVDLKTATGHLTRPVVKIFPLPLN